MKVSVACVFHEESVRVSDPICGYWNWHLIFTKLVMIQIQSTETYWNCFSKEFLENYDQLSLLIQIHHKK